MKRGELNPESKCALLYAELFARFYEKTFTYAEIRLLASEIGVSQWTVQEYVEKGVAAGVLVREKRGVYAIA